MTDLSSLDFCALPDAIDDHRQLRDALRRFVDGEIRPAIDANRVSAGEIALAKNHAARVMRHCADAATQVLGGAGFMRGSRIERIYRDVKVMMIGGGAEEVLNELAARQLGID